MGPTILTIGLGIVVISYSAWWWYNLYKEIVGNVEDGPKNPS